MGRSKISVESKVLRTVRHAVASHRMLAEGDSVLIALSGGPDSVTLADVLHTLAADYRLRLGIAHLNHCLRPKDADRDAEFAAEIARQLDLPFYTAKKDVDKLRKSDRLSLEEAARKVRYEFFDAICSRHGYHKIAVGHHRNDNAELVLMNLLRGSGPQGLSGIAPVRGGKIIRPLIHLKRSELDEYIAERKLAYVTDTSNNDLSFRRNRIRHHLIPELEKTYNPAIVDTLSRLATIMRAENRWIENTLAKDFGQCISVKGPGAVRIDLDQLKGLAGAVRRRVLRRAILTVKNDLRRITLAHIDAVLALVDKSPPTGCLNLPDGIQVDLKTAELTISCRHSGAGNASLVGG